MGLGTDGNAGTAHTLRIWRSSPGLPHPKAAARKEEASPPSATSETSLHLGDSPRQPREFVPDDDPNLRPLFLQFPSLGALTQPPQSLTLSRGFVNTSQLDVQCPRLYHHVGYGDSQREFHSHDALLNSSPYLTVCF